MTSVVRYGPDGTAYRLWVDELGDALRGRGAVPVRASRVGVVAEGPLAGRFFADFSPLAELVGDPQFACCLLTTFARYDEAVAAEQAWVARHWLLGRPVV